MLQNLFLFTRITFLNFHNTNMLALPVLAFIALLALRLMFSGKQPWKALLFILPIAFVVVGIVNAILSTVDNIALIGLMSLLFSLEPALLFGWLGLLLGTLITKVLKKKDKEGT